MYIYIYRHAYPCSRYPSNKNNTETRRWQREWRLATGAILAAYLQMQLRGEPPTELNCSPQQPRGSESPELTDCPYIRQGFSFWFKASSLLRGVGNMWEAVPGHKWSHLPTSVRIRESMYQHDKGSGHLYTEVCSWLGVRSPSVGIWALAGCHHLGRTFRQSLERMLALVTCRFA